MVGRVEIAIPDNVGKAEGGGSRQGSFDGGKRFVRLPRRHHCRDFVASDPIRFATHKDAIFIVVAESVILLTAFVPSTGHHRGEEVHADPILSAQQFRSIFSNEILHARPLMKHAARFQQPEGVKQLVI